MINLYKLLPLLLLVGFAPAARSENIAQCFTVREMVKSEDVRYFVNAISRCSREYDAVYVGVSFFDAKGNHLDDGVWVVYWCRPGRPEIHEFGIPDRAVGFDRVVLRRVSTVLGEAMK